MGEEKHFGIKFLLIELDYFLILDYLVIHNKANLVLDLFVPVFFLPTQSLVFLFLDLEWLKKKTMKSSQIIIFLLTVIRDFPVGSAKEVKKS